MKNLLVFVFLFFIAFSSLAQEKSIKIGKGVQVDATHYLSPPVKALGKTVDIYKQVIGKKNVYFIFPQIIYDKKLIKKRVDSAVSQNLLTIEIPLLFMPGEAKKEIINALSKHTGSEVHEYDLRFVPYAYHIVYAKLDSNKDVLVYEKPQLQKQSRYKVSLSSEVPFEVKIKLKFSDRDEMLTFSNSPYFFGEYILQNPDVKSAEMSVFYNDLVSSDLVRYLEGDGKEINNTRIVTHSNNGGFAINLGSLNVGESGGKNSTQVIKDIKRWMSESYMESTVKQFTSNARLHLKCRRIGIKNCESLRKTFHEEILVILKDSASKEEFKLQQIKDSNEYRIIGQGIDDRLKNVAVIVEETISSKNNLKQGFKEQKGIEYIKILKANKDTELNQSFANDVKWERTGGSWVPVSLSLFRVNVNKFTREANYQLSQEVLSGVSDSQRWSIAGIEAEGIYSDISIPSNISDVYTFGQLKNYVELKLKMFKEEQPAEILAVTLDFKGPKKIVQKVNKYEINKIMGWWSNGGNHDWIFCDTQSTPNGFTSIHGQTHNFSIQSTDKNGMLINSTTQRIYPASIGKYDAVQKCLIKNASRSFCNSGGEFCTLHDGVKFTHCYVNNEWISWNNNRINKAITVEEKKIRKSIEYKCNPNSFNVDFQGYLSSSR